MIPDDTDVFVLLPHYYNIKHLTCILLMIGTSSRSKCADIKSTVERHNYIIDNILPAHVLSVCDTVAFLWGFGNGTVLKVQKSGEKSLNKLGNTHIRGMMLCLNVQHLLHHVTDIQVNHI